MLSRGILGLLGLAVLVPGALGVPGCGQESDEPELVVVRGPDGSPARSVVVLDAVGAEGIEAPVLQEDVHRSTERSGTRRLPRAPIP